VAKDEEKNPMKGVSDRFLLRMVEKHSKGMFVFLIRVFCIFKRFLEDDWRRL